MKNIFDKTDTGEIIARINQLKHDSSSLWGKMTVDQMLAHCNVTYEMIYENNPPKPNNITKLMMKLIFRGGMVNEKPFKKNRPTSQAFIIKNRKVFEDEKQRLIYYINKTLVLGETIFNDKESISFGRLSSQEWNNMLYKHLDHHLKQFGV